MSDDHMSDDDEYEEEVFQFKKWAAIEVLLAWFLNEPMIPKTVHILLDLGTNFAAEALEQMANENAVLELLDLESGSPYVKLGDTIFRGDLDETVTTNLLFEITERKHDTSGLLPLLSTMRGNANDETSDPQRQHEASFQRLSATYMTEADKIIACQRVTLMPKGVHKLVIKAPDDDDENIADLLTKEDESME